MKISEMQEKLETLKQNKGDLPIELIFSTENHSDIERRLNIFNEKKIFFGYVEYPETDKITICNFPY